MEPAVGLEPTARGLRIFSARFIPIRHTWKGTEIQGSRRCSIQSRSLPIARVGVVVGVVKADGALRILRLFGYV